MAVIGRTRFIPGRPGPPGPPGPQGPPGPSGPEEIITVYMDAKGDLLVAPGADQVDNLSVGAPAQVLTADPTQPLGMKWAAPDVTQAEVDAVANAAVQKALADAKGDLFAASANNVVERLPVGLPDQVLRADPGAALGVAWADAPGPYFDVSAPAFGADPAVADNSAAIQAAIDACQAAGGGTVLIPAYYDCLSGITVPNAPINLLGVGDASGLHFPNDLGVGAHGVRTGVGAPATVFQTFVRNLVLRGPHPVQVGQLGNKLCDMHGIQVFGKTTLDSCFVDGFNANVTMFGDHARVQNCWIYRGYCGLLFEDGSASFFDQSVRNCFIDHHRFASVMVEGSNTIQNVAFSVVHLGFSPYCIVADANLTNIFIKRCRFDRVSFEAFGNQAIRTVDVLAGAVGIEETTFDNCGGGWSGAYNIPTASKDYAIETSFFKRNTIRDSQLFTAIMDVGMMRCAGGVGFVENDWQDGQAVIDAVQAAGKPAIVSNTVWAPNRLTGSGKEWRLVRNHGVGAVLAVGDLVEWTDAGLEEVRKRANGAPAGVAARAAAASEKVWIQVSGRASVAAPGAIAAGSSVRADNVNNGAVRAGGAGYRVGHALAAAAGGFVDTFLDINSGSLAPEPGSAQDGLGLTYSDASGGMAWTGLAALSPSSSTRNLIQPTGDFKPVILRGSASQTQPLLDTQRSDGTTVAQITSAGRLSVRPSSGGDPPVSAGAYIEPGASSEPGAVIRGLTSQTGDFLQNQGAGGATVSSFHVDGTVGGAGLTNVANTGPIMQATGFTALTQNRTGTTNNVDTVQGMASQSGDLTRWLDSASSVLCRVDVAGRIGIRVAPIASAALTVAPTATSAPAAVLRPLTSQTTGILEIRDSAGTAIWSRFDKAGYFMTRKVAAPADADLASSELAMWLDDTPAATKAMFKAKDSAGTVKTGSLALA